MPEYEPSQPEGGDPKIEFSGSAWATDINRIRTESGEDPTRIADVDAAHAEANELADVPKSLDESPEPESQTHPE